MEEIVNWCIEWFRDERNIMYSELMWGNTSIPNSMLLDDLQVQDQNEQGYPYWCVFFSDSQWSNIMNLIEWSDIRSTGNEMCDYALAQWLFDPTSGTLIKNWPKVWTALGFLSWYAEINTLEEIKHSIANKRPVQCGSNRINWFSATEQNWWTVSWWEAYGHSIILDWYDDNKKQLRIKQSYKKWDNGHQWLNYTDIWLLFPTKFSLIDKTDNIILQHKKKIMEGLKLEWSKKAFELNLWNGENPDKPISREESRAMLYRLYEKLSK
jgi:hypothetical protein